MSAKKTKEKIEPFSDLGTAELHARNPLEITLINNIPKIVVKNISPIHTYYKRGQIDTCQYSAGVKLYESYITGWVGRNSCEIKERLSGGSDPLQITEKKINAMGEYARGIKAACEYKQVIFDVCIHEKYISKIKKHWYARKKLKEELRKGLTKISKEYGYE